MTEARPAGATAKDLSFQAWMARATAKYKEEQFWRLGQAYFNTLWELRPDLSERIRGNSELDPFFDDKRVGRFLAWVREHWDDNKENK